MPRTLNQPLWRIFLGQAFPVWEATRTTSRRWRRQRRVHFVCFPPSVSSLALSFLFLSLPGHVPLRHSTRPGMNGARRERPHRRTRQDPSEDPCAKRRCSNATWAFFSLLSLSLTRDSHELCRNGETWRSPPDPKRGATCGRCPIQNTTHAVRWPDSSA